MHSFKDLPTLEFISLANIAYASSQPTSRPLTPLNCVKNSCAWEDTPEEMTWASDMSLLMAKAKSMFWLEPSLYISLD